MLSNSRVRPYCCSDGEELLHIRQMIYCPEKGMQYSSMIRVLQVHVGNAGL